MSDDAAAAPKHQFLTDEWMAETRAIRLELKPDGGSALPGKVLRMNQTITEVPFGEGTINVHLDTESGDPDLELGHLDQADVTLTLDYATAKGILVEGNPQVAMQAFMSGKIKVDGDMAILLEILQRLAAEPDPVTVAIARRIRAMTD